MPANNPPTREAWPALEIGAPPAWRVGDRTFGQGRTAEGVPDAPAPALALARLARALPGLRPVLLASSGGAPERYSWLAFDPWARIEWRVEAAAAWRAFAALLTALEARAAEVERAGAPGPFEAGFIGALSYDLHAPGGDLALPAALPVDDADGATSGVAPLVVGGLHDQFLVWDHAAATCTLVYGDARLGAAVRAALHADVEPAPPPGGLAFRRETPRAAHERGVRAVQAAILDGELYQANLSHRLVGELDARAWAPTDAFAALAAANPVPYAAYLEWGSGALLSASPELLVECDAHCEDKPRTARTRPIKGTAPRGSTPGEDAALGAGLLASAKDRAELAMIVDLERNDLGRVAALHADRSPSVRVPEPRRLERYASVQHLVADVECTLAPECSTTDLLAAVFPGGSITGAPKLRSMEVIAALEGRGRSFFTGSLGFVDAGGAAAFNILIRTLIWNTRTGAASLRVGGGVTWASDPAAEDAETLHKAASLLAALGIELA